jgi:hypothetical protein
MNTAGDAFQGKSTGGRLSVAYLVAPLLAVLCAAPAIIEFRVGVVSWWMSNLPFWIGLASAPGYVYAWSERWRRPELDRLRVFWVHASLAGAFLASFWGSILLVLTILFWVFPAISAALTLHLWLRFARRGSPHSDEMGTGTRPHDTARPSAAGG